MKHVDEWGQVWFNNSLHLPMVKKQVHHRWGWPCIYFPIGDHVNVSWCRSHTNTSGVIATSHIVVCHITKLLSTFRHILQFCFRENQQWCPSKLANVLTINKNVICVCPMPRQFRVKQIPFRTTFFSQFANDGCLVSFIPEESQWQINIFFDH